jgi:hypothetical protein
MHGFSAFDWVEAIGWFASLLTVATYAMNTMIPLRILAIASSVCFATYASILQLWPLLAMELLLLPINLYRFWQILSLRGKVNRTERGQASEFSVIKAYGTARTMKAGTVVFAKGDPVDQLYYLESGRVLIEELGITLESGAIFGEMAFFTDAARRTATARCVQDAKVHEIDKKRFMRLQFEDPAFGLSVMRTITRRLMDNAARNAQAIAAASHASPAGAPLARAQAAAD